MAMAMVVTNRWMAIGKYQWQLADTNQWITCIWYDVRAFSYQLISILIMKCIYQLDNVMDKAITHFVGWDETTGSRLENGKTLYYMYRQAFCTLTTLCIA